jgi:uncharacterized membrane-anchored protein
MSKRFTDEQIDGLSCVQSAMWFSLMEALGPEIAARAADNLRDFGVLYSYDPRVEERCNALADGKAAK